MFLGRRVALMSGREFMLRQVKVPVSFTHPHRQIDLTSANPLDATSEQQVQHMRRLVESTGNSITYRSFSGKAHSMNG